MPGTTVDRQCGSSQQAAHFAAQGVIAGAYDVVVAAGVEVMTRVPMGASIVDGKFGFPFGPGDRRRATPIGRAVPQGISAEMIADKWGITREELDAFGAAQPAARRRGPRPRAASSARSCRCRSSVEGGGRSPSADEGIRADTTPRVARQAQAGVPPRRTAARSRPATRRRSPTAPSAVLIMSEEKAAALGLTPRARFVDFALAGADPRD